MIAPSVEVSPIGLIVEMATAWLVHTFRHLTAVLFFNRKAVDCVSPAFTVLAKERRAIAIELLAIVIIHGGICAYLRPLSQSSKN